MKHLWHVGELASEHSREVFITGLASSSELVAIDTSSRVDVALTQILKLCMAPGTILASTAITTAAQRLTAPSLRSSFLSRSVHDLAVDRT